MINDVDMNEILVSNKLPFGKKDFKYFFGYKDNRKTRPLCIELSLEKWVYIKDILIKLNACIFW